MAGTWRLALRNVTRSGRRSALAASAVFFGVLALVAVRSTLNGLQSAWISALVDKHTGALQVHRKGYLKQVVGTPLALRFSAQQVLETAQAVPGVHAVSARLAFGGLLNANDISLAALFVAYDPAAEARVCPQRGEEMAWGRPMASGTDEETVATAALAKRLKWDGTTPGAVLAPDVDGVLNAVNLTLVGAQGLPNTPGLEARVVNISLAAAQQLLRAPGQATEVAVSVAEPGSAKAVQARLQQALGDAYEVHTWDELVPAVRGELHNQEQVFAVMVLVFLLAALVGITNTLLVSMLERTREVGTMLALGARRRRIVNLFMAEGVALALLGCITGLLGGALFVSVASALGIHIRGIGGGMIHIYPHLRLSQGLHLAAMCAAGAAVASLYPAWRASQLSPVDAMGGTGAG